MEEFKLTELFDAIGQCYHGLGMLDVAGVYYNEAVGNTDRLSQYLVNRARCYGDQGKYKGAIADYSEAAKKSDDVSI